MHLIRRRGFNPDFEKPGMKPPQYISISVYQYINISVYQYMTYFFSSSYSTSITSSSAVALLESLLAVSP